MSTTINHGENYGEGDATYQSLGGIDGITALVDAFYRIMDSDEAFQSISQMHNDSAAMKREKLTYFLCGWTGGAESYRSHFGHSISMPSAHAHLTIGQAERDQWLNCMEKAINEQGYSESLKTYLLKALAFPADRIVMVSEKMQVIRAQEQNQTSE